MLYVNAGTAAGANSYAYCMNNPVMYTDPSGEIAISLTLASILAGLIFAAKVTAVVAVAGLAVYTGYQVGTWAANYDWTRVEDAFGNISFAKKTSKKSGKEKSTDKPSWVNPGDIWSNQTAQQNANRLMNQKYGPGNWKKGPNTEFNKILKWIVRSEIIKRGIIIYLEDDTSYFFADATNFYTI